MNESPTEPGRSRGVRRVIGFFVLAVCVGLVVMLVVPGAGEVAHALGKRCPRTRGGNHAQCHALDVIVVVVFVLPMLLLIGLALIESRLVVRRVGDDRHRSSHPR